MTGGFCGFDKEGSPIRVELFGYLDMKVSSDPVFFFFFCFLFFVGFYFFCETTAGPENIILFLNTCQCPAYMCQIKICIFKIVFLSLQGIMYSSRKIDLEKTKLLQCETTVRDWEIQSQKVYTVYHHELENWSHMAIIVSGLSWFKLVGH